MGRADPRGPAAELFKQARGYDVLRKLLGNGLVTSEGDFWRRQRRIAQPAFHRERIQGFATLMRAAAQDAVADWEPFVEHGATFDLAAEFSGGPRKCIGDVFAQLEAKTILVTVFQHVRLSLAPSHLVLPDPTVTLRPREGLKMIARGR